MFGVAIIMATKLVNSLVADLLIVNLAWSGSRLTSWPGITSCEDIIQLLEVARILFNLD